MILGKRGAPCFPNGKLGMGRRTADGLRPSRCLVFLLVACACVRSSVSIAQFGCRRRRTGGFGLGRICLGGIVMGDTDVGMVDLCKIGVVIL